jgi:hypothetical protein
MIQTVSKGFESSMFGFFFALILCGMASGIGTMSFPVISLNNFPQKAVNHTLNGMNLAYF